MHAPPVQNQPIYFSVGPGTFGSSVYKVKWLCLLLQCCIVSSGLLMLLQCGEVCKNRQAHSESYFDCTCKFLNQSLITYLSIKPFLLSRAQPQSSCHIGKQFVSLSLFPLFLPIVQLLQTRFFSHVMVPGSPFPGQFFQEENCFFAGL